ncbi:MAG: 1-deoxy-D-xylulose-5-phosphate reductoisomerase [Rhodanobacter sp.]
MKRVAVLGATGSIGSSTLDVIARHPGQFCASVLTAHRHVDALVALCVTHRPQLAIIADPALEPELARRLRAAGVHCDIASGHAALATAAAGALCDVVVAAIVGAAGLDSTLAAARAGKRLLLANKEAIVMAGPLLLEAVRSGGGALLPVDSEHNAIFQCLPPGQTALGRAQADSGHAGVRRLILTASGGPFRGWTRKQLATVTPDQACKHPNWVMGRKISVDSATLMNKGLEVIEAHHLFAMPVDAIDVVVHPQSLVHSFVEYIDGSVLAQLGHPDMRTAIACALAWPERIESGVGPLDLATCAPLTFAAPDRATFRCLDLAAAALRAGGDSPAILNAANETAVDAFLAGALPFLGIADVVESVLAELPGQVVVDVPTLCERDAKAREVARRIMRHAC